MSNKSNHTTENNEFKFLFESDTPEEKATTDFIFEMPESEAPTPRGSGSASAAKRSAEAAKETINKSADKSARTLTEEQAKQLAMKKEALLRAKKEALLQQKKQEELRAKEAALRARKEELLRQKKEALLRQKKEELLRQKQAAALKAKQEETAKAQAASPSPSKPGMTEEEMREKAREMARERFLKDQKSKQMSVQNFHEQLAAAEAEHARQEAEAERLRALEDSIFNDESFNAPPKAAEKAPEPKPAQQPLQQTPVHTSKHDAESHKKKTRAEKKAEKAELKAREKENKASRGGRFARMKYNFAHPLVFLKEIFTKPNPNYDPNAGDYVIVNGKKKNTKRVFSIGKTIRNFIVIGVAMVLIFVLFAGAVIATAPSIEPKNIYDEIAQSSIIYDDEGQKIDSVNAGQDRTIVQYDELNPQTVNAFVSLEDKTFWKHHGFNWTRMIGAVVSSVTRGGGVSGTSTITQQLARNVYLPNIKSQRSIRRKLLEMYYAARIEQDLSKEEIVTAYLNSIYFGFGCYGIENAAETYFSTNVGGLTLEQSAALAAMPQSPDTYALIKSVSAEGANDYTTPITINGETYLVNDIAKSRRQTCLNLMADQGYITTAERDEVYNDDLSSFINPTIQSKSNQSSYFTDYTINTVIKDLMEKYDLDYSNAYNMVYTGGLEIKSTMNAKAQKAVEDGFANKSYFPSLTGLNKDSNGNIVSDTGSITLYSYDNMIQDGNFVLQDGEYNKNADGSITIIKGKRLNIYETTVNNGTDYSLEFKPSYIIEDGDLYIYPGGYVNIPQNAKKLDDGGNLVISASYVKKNPNLIADVNGAPAFTAELYTMQSKVIQPQGAMVITEVGTGEVKAMVGGRGVTGQQLFNRATSQRQPGSSIKPLAIYSAALQKSYEYAQSHKKFQYIDPKNDTQGTQYYGDYLTAASIIDDEPIIIGGKVWPKNSDNTYRGQITMRDAMKESVNVAAVKIYEQLGSDYCADMVEKYGITTLDREGAESDMAPAALALGGLSNGVSPYEMSEAYATFPNGGTRVENRVYTEVTDRDGKVILSTEKKEHDVIDKGVAYIMVSMMQTVVSSGTGTNARISGVAVGGKTGTTDNHYDIWFDGFTPHYAASLWIGTDVNIRLTASSSATAALWGHIMRNVPGVTKGSYPSMPSNVVKKDGEYFTKGTETGLYKKQAKEEEEQPQEEATPAETTPTEDPQESEEEQKPDSGDSGSGETTPTTPSTDKSHTNTNAA